MNKKVLSAILFSALFAGTGTFTSCIDNDEPAGIENLRGAKAELIRAKVAVEAANATYKLAEAEVQKAEAAIKNAQAELKKALAEEQELKNELLSIQNEEARFDLEQKIAAAELASKEAQLKHEIAMTKLNEQLASAKRNYELFLAHLEIAKATLADKDVVALFELENAADKAQGVVEDAQAKVKAAEDNYYLATLDAKKGEVIIKRYENQVTIAEDALAVAQEAYEKWNDLLSEDAETADWTAEITTLEDSIKGLEKKQVELTVELAKLQNAEAYKNLIDAANKTASDYNSQKTTKKYSFTDAWNNEVVTAKNTPIENAMVEIGGAKKDGKGGRIAAINNRIAYYTSERKAVLDLIAANYEKELADAKTKYETAVSNWTTAKANYANAQDISAASMFKAGEGPTDPDTGKLVTYLETRIALNAKLAKAIEDLANNEINQETFDEKKKDITEALMLAKQKFADEVVAFYNSLPTAQVGFTSVTLATEVDDEVIYASKTVKEWLSDASLKHKNLDKLETYFTHLKNLFVVNSLDHNADGTVDGEKKKTTGEVEYKVTGAFSSFKQKSQMKTALVNASKAAFGEELLVGETLEDGYMHVAPTEAEVMAVEDYQDNCGKLGWYIYIKQESTQYEAKNYEAIIAKYEEGVTYWTGVLTELTTARAEAKAAKDAAADAKADYEEENFDAINKEINGEIGGRIAALTRIKNALASAVTSYLQVDYANFDGSVKFEEWLKEQAADAKLDVFSAEEALIKAQNDLTKVQDGKVDVWAVLAEAEEELADAMAELEAAQAELDTALDNLAKGLEIIAALNTAE